MINYRTAAILKREVRQQVFSRKFIFMTLSFPLIMLVLIGVQVLFVTFDSNRSARIVMLTEDDAMEELLMARFAQGDFDSEGRFSITWETAAPDEVDGFIAARREALLEGEITGVFHVPRAALDDKQVSYYSANPGNEALLDPLRIELNGALIGQYFTARGLDLSSVEFARRNVRVDGVRVTETGTTQAGRMNMAVAFFFTFLLYVSLLGTGTSVMGAVNEEKVSRVVEILLSSVDARELMAGKILGTAVTGLVQMTIWLMPALLLIAGSLPALAMFSNLDIQVELGTIVYFMLNYLVGLLTFISIFAAFGAMFENPQDAQASMMPVFMLIIIPFFLSMSMANNPGNVLAEVGSMLPFFSIMVMPARMTLIDVPLWQLGVALAVNLATLYGVIRLTGKIYRFTILMTGKSPTWKEIYRWMRYA